jgi:ABC-2 type transport system permease protein
MFRRVFAQARKELTQIVRDRLALVLALVLPLFLILLLSNALSLTVHDMPIIVQDLDSTSASRSYIDAFRASGTFHVVPWPDDRKVEEALTTGKARAVLIIPVNFGHDLARGQTASVQLLIDATDANTAKLVNGYAGQISRAYGQRETSARPALMVNPQFRLWFNPGLDAQKFYAPGIFVLGLSMFPPLLASLAMAREGEQKTILQVYVSSISAHEFLLGKILAFMMIALAEFALALTLLFSVFGLRLAGDPSAFLVGTILYAFCVATFGAMVGAAIPNQAAAIQAVALGGFLLVFLLSGLIYPVENIPAGLRWISNLVWGRYYIVIVRDALLQGGGWPAMWFNNLMIGVIGAIFYLISWRSMRNMQVKA